MYKGEFAMIKKTKEGYVLYSKKSGKRLSKPGSLEAARKRERQVQYFKHKH
jgi:hypothetical protein